jgi:hypothetical protein
VSKLTNGYHHNPARHLPPRQQQHLRLSQPAPPPPIPQQHARLSSESSSEDQIANSRPLLPHQQKLLQQHPNQPNQEMLKFVRKPDAENQEAFARKFSDKQQFLNPPNQPSSTPTSSNGGRLSAPIEQNRHIQVSFTFFYLLIYQSLAISSFIITHI